MFNIDPVTVKEEENRGGFDLAAWNVNRGRDQGIASGLLGQVSHTTYS